MTAAVALAMLNDPLPEGLQDGVLPGFEVEIACTRFSAPKHLDLKPAKEAFAMTDTIRTTQVAISRRRHHGRRRAIPTGRKRLDRHDPV